LRGRKYWRPLFALREVRAERDACRVRAAVIQRDFFAEAHTSSSRCKHLTDLSRTLEERQIPLSLPEVVLEVREAILAKELERGLHSFDGQDLSVELDKARALADGITDERMAEAMQLTRLVMGISNALVNLGMLLVQDILQLPKLAQEVLPMVDLICNHLQEALASSVGPWV
jgi:hypothetical protein